MADIREIKVINRVYVKSNHARRVMDGLSLLTFLSGRLLKVFVERNLRARKFLKETKDLSLVQIKRNWTE